MTILGDYNRKSMTGEWLRIILAFLLHIAVFGQSKVPTNKDYQQNQLEATSLGELLLVKKGIDFKISGNGDNEEWNNAEWNLLTKLDSGGVDYMSKFKILASEKGLYVLFQGEDNKITTKNYQDMDKIWNGDVFEIFFQTDTQETKYFEYEVNQFEKQLLLTISNSKNGVSWIPFNEYDRNTYGTINKVEILGGPQELDAKITSWSSEIFISYKSLGLLSQVPPKSGDSWNVNFYRSDYDTGSEVRWSWSPAIEHSFHDLEKFRTIKFE